MLNTNRVIIEVWIHEKSYNLDWEIEHWIIKIWTKAKQK